MVELSREVPMFRTTGFTLKITGGKKVVVHDYQGMRYVGLQQLFNGKDGVQRVARINLSESEWDAFMAHLNEIDERISPVGVKKCPACKGEKTVVHDKILLEVRATEEERQSIKLENFEVQNQLGVKCEECACVKYYDCHCHAYDCRECNDVAFCDVCGENKFLYLGN